MRMLLAAALAGISLAAPLAAHPGHGEDAAAEMPAAAPVATARLNLDTPVETIVADPAGKAVLEANLPGISTHEHYEGFKRMGLRQMAGFAPDKLTPEVLAKTEAELAAIK